MLMGKVINWNPTIDKERIISIDIVRGIALIGIIFVNFDTYLITLLDYLSNSIPIMQYSAHPFDPYLQLAYSVFIHTKFYSIFSFLFGLGFYMFMSRCEAHGAKIFRFFTRRLFALLFIGVLHLLSWFGSILFLYALLGFFLMPFYRRKPKTILNWALAFFSISILTSTDHRAISFWFPFAITDLTTIFGMFLLGLYAGKRNIVIQMQNHAQLLHRTTIFSIIVGTISSIGSIWYIFGTIPESAWMLVDISSRISTFSMTLFYLSSLFLLLQNKALSNFLKPIANMGKMAVSVYVAQNFLGSLFIHLFGLKDGFTLFQLFLMSLLIIAIELIGANLYVMKFKQGPLEMIWRKMTYGFKSKKKARVYKTP